MTQSILLLINSLLWIVGVGLILLGLLYIFCPFAIVYRVEPSGRKKKVGYLWRVKGDYILYDSLLPLFASSRMGFIRGYEVRPLVMNIQHNLVQKTLGTFTDDGRVMDLSGNQVGSCEHPDQRSTYILDASGERIGYICGALPSKQDLIVRAAGFAVLREKEQEDYAVFDVRVGLLDLMLPSALIYMVLYYPLVLLTIAITETHPSLYILVMLLWYLLIIAILYIIKYEKTMQNGAIDYLIGLVDRNVGVKGLNICIIIAAFVALRVASEPILPLFAVTFIGFLCNLFCFNSKWHIEEPSSGWSGRIPTIPTVKPSPAGVKVVTREFSWKPILEVKGIQADEKIELSFTDSDFNGIDSTVRKANPFRNGAITSDEDLCKRAQEVLVGAQTADGCEEVALAKILNSAYQLTLQYGLADFEMYDLLLGFVQSNVHYETDDKSESIGKVLEYFRYASETLYDKEGDCDCKSVLAYQLFKRLGVDVDLVEVESGETTYRNHVAIVLHNTSDAKVQLPPDYVEYATNKGVYCEATGFGFKPGDVPEDINTDSIKVMS